MAISTPASRPWTPSQSPPPPPDVAAPPIPQDQTNDQISSRRRTSFSFLRRGKSVERLNSKRSISGGKLSKKPPGAQGTQAEQKATAIPKQAPKIPDISLTDKLQTFGGEHARYDSPNTHHQPLPPGAADMRQAFIAHAIPMPPPVPKTNSGRYVDPYARTESMTHRGRYSYASSVASTINGPRRVRRRKDPTPFNVLVVGARNCGKTSFLNFLRSSLALPAQKQSSQNGITQIPPTPSSRKFRNFVSRYLETEMEDGERIGLTLWDSEGLEKNVIDLQLREMTSFLESKFEETFDEENKVVRSPGVQDSHIHCVFMILDPLRLDTNLAAAHKTSEAANGPFVNGKSYVYSAASEIASGLDEDLDLPILRALQGKTTVVPVISKADTITVAHMQHLKQTVYDALKKAKVDSIDNVELDDDDGAEYLSVEATMLAPKHNSKRLDERDEDYVLRRDSTTLAPPDNHGRHSATTSHLDSASSDSGSSSPAPKHQRPPSLTHSRRASSIYSVPPATPGADSLPFLPLSVISPDMHDPGVIGRQFPWGFADPYNADHCDFGRLKEAVFKEWRGEMREASRELWYERWRTSRLNAGVVNGRGAQERQQKGMGFVGRAM